MENKKRPFNLLYFPLDLRFHSFWENWKQIKVEKTKSQNLFFINLAKTLSVHNNIVTILYYIGFQINPILQLPPLKSKFKIWLVESTVSWNEFDRAKFCKVWWSGVGATNIENPVSRYCIDCIRYGVHLKMHWTALDVSHTLCTQHQVDVFWG